MTDDEIIQYAGAFVIQFGGPPTGLNWRSAGFEKRTLAAQEYCVELQIYLQEQFPALRRSMTNTVRARNKVLREIFTSSNIKERF